MGAQSVGFLMLLAWQDLSNIFVKLFWLKFNQGFVLCTVDPNDS